MAFYTQAPLSLRRARLAGIAAFELLTSHQVRTVDRATLPAAKAAGSISLQLVDCDHRAFPVKAEVCVPAESVTEIVAVFVPIASAVRGLNCSVTTHVAPGASVVRPKS